MNSYDIDGVIYLGPELEGLTPVTGDFIITGRSVEEHDETRLMLWSRDIHNRVFYNPLPFAQKTRVTSGIHKGNTLNYLKSLGYDIKCHFEDDEVQVEQIRLIAPWVKVIHLVHDLTEKENVRHAAP